MDSPYLELEVPDDDQKIWRYMDFTKFLSLLETRSLYLCVPAKMSDQHEGGVSSYLKEGAKRIDERISSGEISVDLENLLLDIDGYESENEFFIGSFNKHGGFYGLQEWMSGIAKGAVGINCWHLSEYESDAMWRLYLTGNEGISIQSRFSRLKKSITDPPRQVIIGKVNYLDWMDERFNTTDPLELVFFKRKCFEHEKELRIASPADLRKIGEDVDIRDLTLDILLSHDMSSSLNVDLGCLIEKIYVAPLAPDWFLELVKAVVKRYGLDKEVVRSEI